MISITEKEFNRLADFMRGNYGINLKFNEKKHLVVGRLQNVLAQKNFNSFSEFYEYVITDKTGEAVTTLINKLTTNHTFFMREPKHFEYFRDHLLPKLASGVPHKDMRIWSAGCSSGEEAYTLAMIISDFFSLEKALWDTRILATDISTKVIETAVTGVYLNEQVDTLPEHWKKCYFQRLDQGKSALVDKIKNEVIFRKFNLMNPVFPFKKKFHVVFCRNVMIYFDNNTKKELVNRFYEFTEPGGYLFIGHSEALNREDTKYRYVMPAIYRKE